LLRTIVSLTIDGLSYGMILFLISSGLTITLGVMRIVNMAHGAFAMIGGYLALTAVNKLGVGLFPALALAVAGTVVIAIALERTVYRWVYGTSELGQVLMTIGLTFVIIAVITILYNTSNHTLPVPGWLAGSVEIRGVTVSAYRSFLVVLSTAIAVALWYGVERTDFGSKLRAAVDNPRMARCAGINVQRIFAFTFAVGCGLAAVGGVLGTQMLALEPFYAVRYLILVLMVVAVGGLGSLKGSFIAALVLGMVETYGRYVLESGGGFVAYVLVFILLVMRPQGLFARA
jgi:branched-chain amino acid transport system permease protein